MDNKAFLEEIRSDPQDVTPRLVYADWLEENGDPQAELIRVQCELDELPASASAEREELRRREKTLLRNYHAEWVEPLQQLDVRGIEIRRGFVEAIRLDAEVFLANAAEIVARVPALCSLNLRKSRKFIKRLAQVPELEQVRFLDLRLASLENADLKVLLNSPHLINLVGLNLQGNRLTARAATLLSGCGNLSQLRSLNIAGNRIRSQGFVSLGNAEFLNQLTRLEAWNCDITGKGLSQFALTTGLPRLKFLNVAQNRFRDSIAEFRSQTRPLRSLNLNRSDLTQEHAEIIADTPGLSQLEELRINAGIQPGGLTAILTSPHLNRLRSLQACLIRGAYSQTRMDLPGDLRGRGAQSLRRLDLSGNPLTRSAVEKLAGSGCLESVEELILSGTHLEDSGLESLLASCPDRLATLQLDNNALLTPRCLQKLAEWTGLPSLRRLLLPDASVLDEKNVGILMKSPLSEELRIILSYYAEPEHEANIKKQLRDTWPVRFEKLFSFPHDLQ